MALPPVRFRLAWPLQRDGRVFAGPVGPEGKTLLAYLNVDACSGGYLLQHSLSEDLSFHLGSN